jgi:hypothetical protein
VHRDRCATSPSEGRPRLADSILGAEFSEILAETVELTFYCSYSLLISSSIARNCDLGSSSRLLDHQPYPKGFLINRGIYANLIPSLSSLPTLKLSVNPANQRRLAMHTPLCLVRVFAIHLVIAFDGIARHNPRSVGSVPYKPVKHR